jgi:AraC-like DNA-binding protein
VRASRSSGVSRSDEGAEPGISGSIVAPVLAALAALGVDPRALLEAGPSNVLVPGTRADRCLDQAAALLRDEGLGIRLVKHIPMGGLGIIDYTLCTSSTLGDALRRVSRHYGLATQRVKLHLIEGPRASLVLETRSDTAPSRHWLEFSLAMIAERMRQTAGDDIHFDEVTFRHEPPADSAAGHDTFFGTHVRFSQPEDRVSFDPSLLDRPLRTASALLARLLDTKIEELAKSSTGSFLDEARGAIASLLDERDTRLESAASRLHVSRRTLQRELRALGTSHKELLESIRRERALSLLRGTTSVAEVASRLGYAEPSAFFRAFRRWTGGTPRARQAGEEEGEAGGTIRDEPSPR